MVRTTYRAAVWAWLLAVSIGVAGAALMPAVHGDNDTRVGNVNDLEADVEAAAAMQIEEFTSLALASGKIPVSELLDRVGGEWALKYDSTEEFVAYNTGTRNFITTYLGDNDWNGINAEKYLSIYNFDTMIGMVDSGHEITLLVSKLHELQGRYNASEPVQRFHKWLVSNYDIPESEQGVTDRLVEILGDRKFLNLVEEVAQNFNDLADNGLVPYELAVKDPKYWTFTANINMCKHISGCDPDMYLQFRNEWASKATDPRPAGFDTWDYLIPGAYASNRIADFPYSLSLSVYLRPCEYSSCLAMQMEWMDNGGPSSLKIISVENPDHDDTISDNREPAIVHIKKSYTAHLLSMGCPYDRPGNAGVTIETSTTVYLRHDLAVRSMDGEGNKGLCAFTSLSYTLKVDRQQAYGGGVTTAGAYRDSG